MADGFRLAVGDVEVAGKTVMAEAGIKRFVPLYRSQSAANVAVPAEAREY